MTLYLPSWTNRLAQHRAGLCAWAYRMGHLPFHLEPVRRGELAVAAQRASKR